MSLVIVPILPGKVEEWLAWTSELKSEKKTELDDLNRRYQLTLHRTWFAGMPCGPIVANQYEGPGAPDFLPRLVDSNHPFDREFRAKFVEIHGIDLSNPSGHLPELTLDSAA